MNKAQEKIQHLWCQHCKALQKSNNTVVECWYNPLDHGYEKAFCAANEDAVKHILKVIEELGYRKLPEGEPPLLSDEEIDLAIKSDVTVDIYQKVAQAQRDSDIKYYGGIS